MLPWLLIVWRLVACGAAGYKVPDMHHLRWTRRKAAHCIEGGLCSCGALFFSLPLSFSPSLHICTYICICVYKMIDAPSWKRGLPSLQSLRGPLCPFVALRSLRAFDAPS